MATSNIPTQSVPASRSILESFSDSFYRWASPSSGNLLQNTLSRLSKLLCKDIAEDYINSLDDTVIQTYSQLRVTLIERFEAPSTLKWQHAVDRCFTVLAHSHLRRHPSGQFNSHLLSTFGAAITEHNRNQKRYHAIIVDDSYKKVFNERC